MRYLFIVKQTQWNSFRDIIGIIEFSHVHAVSYLGQLLRIYTNNFTSFYKFVSHKYDIWMSPIGSF